MLVHLKEITLSLYAKLALKYVNIVVIIAIMFVFIGTESLLSSIKRPENVSSVLRLLMSHTRYDLHLFVTQGFQHSKLETLVAEIISLF